MSYKLFILIIMVAVMAFGKEGVQVASLSKCAGHGPRLRSLVTVCNNFESNSRPFEIIETSGGLWQICDPENGKIFEYLLTDPFNIPSPIVCAVLKVDDVNDCKCEASKF